MKPRQTLALLLLIPLHAQPQQHTLAEQYLFSSVNAERIAAGLPLLTWNVTLQPGARAHAEQMRAAHTLSHQLPGEPGLTARAAQTGAHFSEVAENVAVGQSILEMHDALMHSPHHRENILDPAITSLAIAVAAARHDLWAVEDFARDVHPLTATQQETRVLALLNGPPLRESIGTLTARATSDARATCAQDTGYTGPRPGFIMRYVTSDLARLPDQLTARLATGNYTQAAVGACPLQHGKGFSSYNLAILLYR